MTNLLIGLFIGAFFGMLSTALLHSAARADALLEREKVTFSGLRDLRADTPDITFQRSSTLDRPTRL
jgi:hypothetical protein